MRLDLISERLCVGIGDDEIDALRPAAIMLLTALPPAPPTPNTVMRAFISRISVTLLMFTSQFDTGCYLQALAVCFHYGLGSCLEQLHHQAIGALALKVCPVIRRPSSRAISVCSASIFVI